MFTLLNNVADFLEGVLGLRMVVFVGVNLEAKVPIILFECLMPLCISILGFEHMLKTLLDPMLRGSQEFINKHGFLKKLHIL